MVVVELDDCLLFVVGQPVVTRDPAVVLVRTAAVFSPAGECGNRYAGPAGELLSRDLRFL